MALLGLLMMLATARQEVVNRIELLDVKAQASFALRVGNAEPVVRWSSGGDKPVLQMGLDKTGAILIMNTKGDVIARLTVRLEGSAEEPVTRLTFEPTDMNTGASNPTTFEIKR